MTEAVTFVSFLLDRTGSMDDIKDDTIGGFNAYVESLRRDAEGEVLFTLVTFDTAGWDRLCDAVPLSEVPLLTRENYVPRYATNLVDSSVRIVRETEERVRRYREEGTLGEGRAIDVGDRPEPRILVVIQTDGRDNRSTEHTYEEMSELVAVKTNEGWAFTFLGAGIDAYEVGQRMGVGKGHTMSYGRGASGQAFMSMARSASAYTVSGAQADAAFLDSERVAVGDSHRVDPEAGDEEVASG